MIRPFTLLTAMLFALSGAYLFAVKHRAQVLDDEIAATAQATRLDQQRIRVLQAQWALEVDPSRLAQLSAQFTQLQPMKPSQLVTLASLNGALPPPGSSVPGQNPAGGAPAVIATTIPDAAAQQNDAPQRVAVEPVKPVVVASKIARPERLASVETILHRLPLAQHKQHLQRHQAETLYAEAQPQQTQGSALAVQAYAAPSPRTVAQLLPVHTATQSYIMPPPMDGGSMLGMAQSATPAGNNN
jgi:hypothetical protein